VTFQVVAYFEDRSRSYQQGSNFIKPEKTESGLSGRQLLGRQAFYRVQHTAIHGETVCLKQVR
jgi:hypothetical protein